MQNLTCPSCTTVNSLGETVCRECGAALVSTAVVAPVAIVQPETQFAPVAQVSPIVERSPVMVVDRGMSDQAKILTALFTIVGLVLIGVAFYAWSESNRSQDQLERARIERERRPLGSAPPASAPAAPAPVIITTPAPTTVTAPSSTADSGIADSREIAAYVSSVEPMLQMWREGVSRTETSDNAQVTGAINTLRDVESRIAGLNPPAAAAGVHGRLLTSMRNMLNEITSAAEGRTASANSEGYLAARKAFDAAASECGALRSALS